jgi:hypothetical protein
MKAMRNIIYAALVLFGIRSLGSFAVRVKCWATTLATLLVLSASLALAEDFKTVNGKVYKDATVSRVEADGIMLRTKTGISKVYFVELPADVQKRFHYDNSKPLFVF